jgi:hypothetical protein
MRLTKATVNLMTHVVACGYGSFDGRYRSPVCTLYVLGWITYTCTGKFPRPGVAYTCRSTSKGRQEFRVYLKQSKRR